MYGTNFLFKFKMILLIYILICGNILNVWSHSESYEYNSYNNITNYDITTIYKIKEFSNINNEDGIVGFMDYKFLSHCGDNCSIEIHSRTNAIGLPVQNIYPVLKRNIIDLINNGSFENDSNVNVFYDSPNLWRLKTIKLNGNNCDKYQFIEPINPFNTKFVSQYSGIQFEKSLSNYALEFCYDKFLNYVNENSASYYSYNYNYLKKKIISLQWISDAKKTCFAITYILKISSKIKLNINIKNENNEEIFSTYLDKNDCIKTLKITDLNLIKNQKYTLEMVPNFDEYFQYYGNSRFTEYKEFWFGLLQITLYSNNDENGRIISMNGFSGPAVPINILGNYINNNAVSQHTCLNGGLTYSTETQCVCLPGFKGQYCEEGCGSNSFGADCEGVCSIYSNKQCRGMFMCTPYGCTCPPGLTGPLCNKDCGHGKYGNNCEQKCSTRCNNNACDQYTGNCTQGCSPGYLPPYCLQKFPYLLNPPSLVSNNYDTMELLLNFQSSNINDGELNTKLKYYKLLFKTISEDKFSSSEFKLITISNNGTKEVLNDLEPDTMYVIGVLVIMDDGNFNDEDIIYGQYRTLCMSPQNVDYNIKLVSGVRSVNVTWNKITPKRYECNVIEYSLILTSDKTKNQISGVQEIKSSSNNGHFINDLIPGYKYKITLIPKTHYGPLKSSPVITFSPLTANEDVKINNIVVSTDNEKVTVTWKLGDNVENEAIVDEPVTCIVRYKLMRILSCSLQGLQHNWTTVTVYNRTKYEIFDTVPHSQYCVQVLVSTVNKNELKQENIVCTLTPSSSPQIEPMFDFEHPIYVTNNSVLFQWKFDQINCSKLNGFFMQFYVELKDKNESILRVKETKQNYIAFGDLKSNTPYELRIFVKTHFGYNREHFLLTNFITKFENLKPVDDLMVYKKSLKNRMIGLRWSYLENTNLDGFIISFNEDDFTKNQNVTIIPLNRCSAWPDYYCHTFYHLNPSSNYTFKIKPKSQDYPEGGKVSSISFNSIDGLPDSPNNLKTIEISNTTVTLQWDIPWIFNGVLKTFNINVEEVSALDMDTCCVSIAPTEIPVHEELPAYNYTLTDLKPGSTYSIGVITVSRSIWYSSPARISVTTLL